MLKLIRDKSCNSVSIILVLTLRGLAVILSDVMMVLAIRYDIRTCIHHYFIWVHVCEPNNYCSSVLSLNVHALIISLTLSLPIQQNVNLLCYASLNKILTTHAQPAEHNADKWHSVFAECTETLRHQRPPCYVIE